MNETREKLINIIKLNNLSIKEISNKSGLSPTTIKDFLREENDEKFQNLGCIGYSKIKKLFNDYNEDINLWDCDFKKTYGHGICDISGVENGKQMKYYETWKGMLRRCYSNKYHKKEPTYKNCEVCEEWLLFSNFKKWYKDNYYQIDNDKVALDKDILNKGNKVYNPNDCVFVNQVINNLFTKSNKIRGNLPIGVKQYNNSNKFKVTLSFYDFDERHKSKISLGAYNTSSEAFNVYKKAKEDNIKRVADYYKSQIPIKLYNAMYNYKVDITD